MPDPEKVTESRPVDPVRVAVIATGDVSKMPDHTVATTAGTHLPDFVMKPVQPIVAILIRFINTFVTTLVALMTAGGMTGAIPFTDFLSLLTASAMLAVSVAILGSLKDIVTVFGKLEQKYPLTTGSI